MPVEICKDAARETMLAIDKLIPPFASGGQPPALDFERILQSWEMYTISNPARDFEIVFAAELRNIATYFVSEKSIYDTNRLIEHGDELFPESIRSNFSIRVKQDLRDAGKCLAFDLATAAGFHIARAVEGVLLPYLGIVNPDIVKNLKDSDRNLGNYIRLLKSNGGDDKICGALTQFKDLHRNPLIHPEAVLTVDEALTLLGIAQSAIVAMVTDGQRRVSSPVSKKE